ncbi:transcriptional regulator [Actinomadura sp. HBU206391]|uniref:transcriptional regulator n=1 Tax=Actinomadura sp. HBU206391 TaxID=2731692 RepID=UPI00164FCB61|nr:transcriptional regulator [Actinomadura sp. HBU206391]MBC6456935.1 transcriptional regulator [Actinomadura sp. HBU206391]
MSCPPQREKRLVPTQLAALASGVCEATIRKWASRGKLTRYGSRARAQYDLNELAGLVSTTTCAPPSAGPAETAER